MEEFIYDETKYIKRQDLKDFVELMHKCDFMPEVIENADEFNIAFQYLGNLTTKAPEFLQAYEYVMRMIAELESHENLKWLENDLEQRWIQACERIAEKEDIFNKKVEWTYLENRPLIRGLYHKANKLWESGQLEQAHDLFSKILKTNPDDNIGARYSVKATGDGMSFEDFNKRFTFEDVDGSYYNKDLWEWYGERSC